MTVLVIFFLSKSIKNGIANLACDPNTNYVIIENESTIIDIGTLSIEEIKQLVKILC